MNRYFWLIFIHCSLLTSVISQEAGRLFVLSETTLDKLLEYEDEAIRIKGFVETTNKNATNINFLNFKGSEFQCVTFARYLRNFEKQPMDLYKEKWVEVSGKIYKYRGKPQIHLTDPEQVTIIDQPAPAANKAVVAESKQSEQATEEEPKLPVEPVVKAQPKPNEPVLEVIDGVPAIDWRKYFPSAK